MAQAAAYVLFPTQTLCLVRLICGVIPPFCMNFDPRTLSHPSPLIFLWCHTMVRASMSVLRSTVGSVGFPKEGIRSARHPRVLVMSGWLIISRWSLSRSTQLPHHCGGIPWLKLPCMLFGPLGSVGFPSEGISISSSPASLSHVRVAHHISMVPLKIHSTSPPASW